MPAPPTYSYTIRPSIASSQRRNLRPCQSEGTFWLQSLPMFYCSSGSNMTSYNQSSADSTSGTHRSEQPMPARSASRGATADPLFEQRCATRRRGEVPVQQGPLIDHCAILNDQPILHPPSLHTTVDTLLEEAMVSYPECDGPWALIAVRYTERAFLTVDARHHPCVPTEEGGVRGSCGLHGGCCWGCWPASSPRQRRRPAPPRPPPCPPARHSTTYVSGHTTHLPFVNMKPLPFVDVKHRAARLPLKSTFGGNVREW